MPRTMRSTLRASLRRYGSGLEEPHVSSFFSLSTAMAARPSADLLTHVDTEITRMAAHQA